MNYYDLCVRRNMLETYEAVGMLSIFTKQTFGKYEGQLYDCD